MSDHSNRTGHDLTEASLMEALTLIRQSQCAPALRPTHMVVTEEGIARARQMAADDPEFGRRLREEFPQLADFLR